MKKGLLYEHTANILIILIFGFAIGCGAIITFQGDGTTLEQAYKKQQVDIIQKQLPEHCTPQCNQHQ
jgi:hypothetical protein